MLSIKTREKDVGTVSFCTAGRFSEPCQTGLGEAAEAMDGVEGLGAGSNIRGGQDAKGIHAWGFAVRDARRI